MYMRTAPLVMLAGLSLEGRLNRVTVPRVVRRADEITELLAIWQFVAGRENLKKMPNALKKGIADAMVALDNGKPRFTEYHYRKYNRQGKTSVTFLDALRLTHPRPKVEAQSRAFQMIKDNNLPVIDTWETKISAAGSDLEAKRRAWEEIIEQGMPYMAALRNIRNMLQAGVSDNHIQMWIDLIKNPVAIQKSMQFPFRWYSAYSMLAGKGYTEGSFYTDDRAERPRNWKGILGALEEAIVISAQNIPGLEYLQKQKILIAIDTSASMGWRTSSKSSILLHEIGSVLGFLLQHYCPLVTIGMFAGGWKTVMPNTNAIAGAYDIYNRVGEVGHATNGHLPIEWATKTETKYDRIMIFTDLQLWDTSGNYNNPSLSPLQTEFNRYKRDINPDAKLVLFDLAGHGTSPIDIVRKDVALVSGWSDKVFEIIHHLEEGSDFFERFNRPLG
jgi:hypothetical protein